jgi:hypothetical protein
MNDTVTHSDKVPMNRVSASSSVFDNFKTLNNSKDIHDNVFSSNFCDLNSNNFIDISLCDDNIIDSNFNSADICSKPKFNLQYNPFLICFACKLQF